MHTRVRKHFYFHPKRQHSIPHFFPFVEKSSCAPKTDNVLKKKETLLRALSSHHLLPPPSLKVRTALKIPSNIWLLSYLLSM